MDFSFQLLNTRVEGVRTVRKLPPKNEIKIDFRVKLATPLLFTKTGGHAWKYKGGGGSCHFKVGYRKNICLDSMLYFFYSCKEKIPPPPFKMLLLVGPLSKELILWLSVNSSKLKHPLIHNQHIENFKTLGIQSASYPRQLNLTKNFKCFKFPTFMMMCL